MKFLDIGDVSAKTGISPSALRYYEEIGLIASVSRHGLRRQFEPGVLTATKADRLGENGRLLASGDIGDVREWRAPGRASQGISPKGR